MSLKSVDVLFQWFPWLTQNSKGPFGRQLRSQSSSFIFSYRIRHWFRQSLYIGFGVSPPYLFVCFPVFSVCQGPSLPWTLSSFWLARLQFSFGILATFCGNCLSLSLDQMLLRKKDETQTYPVSCFSFCLSSRTGFFVYCCSALGSFCLCVLLSVLVVRAPVL